MRYNRTDRLEQKSAQTAEENRKRKRKAKTVTLRIKKQNEIRTNFETHDGHLFPSASGVAWQEFRCHDEFVYRPESDLYIFGHVQPVEQAMHALLRCAVPLRGRLLTLSMTSIARRSPKEFDILLYISITIIFYDHSSINHITKLEHLLFSKPFLSFSSV